MMFIVMDSSWLIVFYQAMRFHLTPAAAVVLFVLVSFTFVYALFILFTAILLENFDTTDTEKEDIQKAALCIRVMKVLKGQQMRQMQDNHRRQDKKAWSNYIIQRQAREAQEAKELAKSLQHILDGDRSNSSNIKERTIDGDMAHPKIWPAHDGDVEAGQIGEKKTLKRTGTGTSTGTGTDMSGI